ncbi:MAG: Phosphate acetyltransferase [Planctomycetaceae bacterium]|nr:Phosphate acetyltransferase [Planctomycetaceae bacterium]
MATDVVRVSKFLSLILRHEPQKIGLTLDEQGWAEVEDLVRQANQNGQRLTRDILDRVVAQNDKKRFAFSEDGKRIRASQGHSIEVDLALAPLAPPELLYHGTATRVVDAIRVQGLDKRERQHVHLSLDTETARKVGQRHGKPIILVVRARDMFQAGHQFFLSANGVWLTDRVPVEFLVFPTE